jgi:hypothetical protein
MTTGIYPARVVADGIQYPLAHVRTNVPESRLQVWVKAKPFPHQPICVIDQHIDETIRSYNKWAPRRERWGHWRLTDGRLLTAQTLPGCGCGNPLRSLPSWSATSQVEVGV